MTPKAYIITELKLGESGGMVIGTIKAINFCMAPFHAFRNHNGKCAQ